MSTDVVAKIWDFCHTLRHDGVNYGDYIEQIAYLLFLKMADERGISLPRYKSLDPHCDQPNEISCDWPTLDTYSGNDLIEHYDKLLTELGEQVGLLGDIFSGAQAKIRKPTSLKRLIGLIDETDWTSLEIDVKAAVFEGVLERAASEGKKGAGQYFTPRLLIQTMVRCIKPDPRISRDFAIDDPAVGTGGFLVAAYEWLLKESGGAFEPQVAKRIRTSTYFGQEIDERPRRLALMNLWLRRVEPRISNGDSIHEVPCDQRYDVILTNPPFGTRGTNQAPDRKDFVIATSNKQLNFLQHILTILKPGGRAAVVVPDSVFFTGRAGEVLNVLLENCDLHTVFRCPLGTFSPYTEGTTTNVLFFTKGRPTQRTWIYDGRVNVPKITKKSRPLSSAHFADFERCYGDDPDGLATRAPVDSAEGRWRCFTLDEIKAKNYKLNAFTWFRDKSHGSRDDIPEPGDLISETMEELRLALDDLADIHRLLQGQEIIGALARSPMSLPAFEQLVRFRQALLTAACSGHLTADWRDVHKESADELVDDLRSAAGRKAAVEGDPKMHDGIPSGWATVSLDLLVDRIEAGRSFSAHGRPAAPHEWGVIKVSAMSWGRFLEDQNKAIPDDVPINPHYEIKSGDLLISRANTAELVGAAVLVDRTRRRLLLSDKSLRLVLRSCISKAWLNYALRSIPVRAQLSERATGTSNSMRNLSQGKILATTLLLPPVAEQEEIVHRLDALFVVADRLEDRLTFARGRVKSSGASTSGTGLRRRTC